MISVAVHQIFLGVDCLLVMFPEHIRDLAIPCYRTFWHVHLYSNIGAQKLTVIHMHIIQVHLQEHLHFQLFLKMRVLAIAHVPKNALLR